MDNWLRQLVDWWHETVRPPYKPMIEVRVSGQALRANWQRFVKLVAPQQVVPVLKANAYGHGLRQVAEALRSESAPFWCVDSYYEAWLLRRWGFNNQLLVMGFTPARTMAANRLAGVQFSVGDLQTLRELKKMNLSRVQLCQLKVDTGMHRQGVRPVEVVEALELIMTAGCRVVGVFSHLADADKPGSAITVRQISVWNEVVAQVRKLVPEVTWWHLLATAGTAELKLVEANVVRLGIGLYGIDPYPNRNLDLKPALELITTISSLREIESGEVIGYGGSFVAASRTKIATIPIGYAEGIDRRLSNCGSVLVRGVVCPMVGRVSMNMTTVDVTEVPEVLVGDEVVLISAQKLAKNSVEETAKIIGGIPYEVLVGVSAHLHRKLVD